MCLEEVKAQILSLPEVGAWPEMAELLKRSVVRVKWDFPLLACRAVGGETAAGIPAAAAIACVQLSLVLVDDMLDEDPRGVHLLLGHAATANMAFALQAAAFRILGEMKIAAELRIAASSSLARMALTSAFGQDLDAQNLAGEENYWRIVQAKSATCFGTAFHIGALLGRASPEIAGRLHDLGFLVGEVIQIYDDLSDALQSPASPDWKQSRNNLPILYALTADHPDRARFKRLLTRIEDSRALEAAQQILIRCGAVSYCAYHIVNRYRAARELLDGLSLADPAPLHQLLALQAQPLVALLEEAGAEIPPELGG